MPAAEPAPAADTRPTRRVPVSRLVDVGVRPVTVPAVTAPWTPGDEMPVPPPPSDSQQPTERAPLNGCSGATAPTGAMCASIDRPPTDLAKSFDLALAGATGEALFAKTRSPLSVVTFPTAAQLPPVRVRSTP